MEEEQRTECELDALRAELGAERARREQAERRVEELERQLEARQESQDEPEIVPEELGRGDMPPAPAEPEEATEPRSWWRRIFGG